MIVLAREARGYSQSELAKIISIGQSYLSKIEKGISSPTEEIINKISQKLDFPVTFFEQDERIFTPELLYYRRRISVNKKPLLKTEAIMNIYRMCIEKLLGSVELPETDIPHWDVEEHGSPEDAAIMLRQRWSIPKGRIENLTKVLESKGIIIVNFDFGSVGMDGLSMYSEHNDPIIFINNKIPGDRQRLTIAHELGHLLLHFGQIIDINRDVESEAMKFGAEFLVPKKEFLSSVNGFDLNSLANQKRYWLVSMASLLYRGRELNLLTDNQYRYLWQQMAMLGYKKNEPAAIAVPREHPTILKEVLDLHVNELQYSKLQLAEMLSMNLNNLQEYFYSDSLKLRIIK